MNVRLMAAPAVTAALVVVCGFLAGCGGGGEADELTLHEFYGTLDEIFDGVDERFEALDDECRAADASEEAQIEAARCFFDTSAEVFDESLDEIGALNPPAEAEDAHGEYLASGAEVSRFVEKFLEGPTGTGSVTELDEFLEDPELEEASERFDNACYVLQAVADENEIGIDLDCEG
jgi:hypothetical protein